MRALIIALAAATIALPSGAEERPVELKKAPGLDKVGLKKDAIEILFDGADSGVSDKTPDFVKSIPTGRRSRTPRWWPMK